MSTTYFKKSNIEKLTKKVSKKKDVTDINKKNENIIDTNITETDTQDTEKVVEGFDTRNPTSTSNVFGSSDNDSGTTSSTRKHDSKAASSKAASSQLDTGSILVFCFHALLSVLFVYIWGALATNAVYLISESDDILDYILPIGEYYEPYTKNPDSKKCMVDYGFPYDLGEGRIISPAAAMSDKFIDIKKRQKETTYYLWLSKEGKQNDKNGEGFFGALVQYLFEAMFGGLGKGGRTFIRLILGVLKVRDYKEKDTTKSTWKGKMENRTALKVAAFIVWPFIMMNFLIPVVSIWTGITTIVYGILQNHIFWGIIFSLIIGMFIAMGNGFYMGLQTLYIFFLYPWSNDNSNRTDEWKDIFNNLKTYMLLAFYFIICFYGYEDLGASGGAGIMFIVIVSIILQYWKNSS